MLDKLFSERVVYYFVYVETDDYYEWTLKVGTLEGIRFCLHSSYWCLYFLGTSTDDKYNHISTQPGKTPPFVIIKGKIPKVKKPTTNAVYFTNFSHNYYPNVDAKPQSKALFTVE